MYSIVWKTIGGAFPALFSYLCLAFLMAFLRLFSDLFYIFFCSYNTVLHICLTIATAKQFKSPKVNFHIS